MEGGKDEVALVTGASGGLGEGIARTLAQKGVLVVLVARRKEVLDDVVGSITSAGGRAVARATDITSREEVEALGRWVREEVGLPTILVNNAGLGGLCDFASQPAEVWEPIIELNITAGLYCISEFLADMKEKQHGHIVNITSLNERVARADTAVYTGTKHFWTGASECLRKELVGTGVKVTNILPGVCNTPAFTKAAAALVETGDVEEVARKLIQPEDVGMLVWEAVSKPERCYVKDIFMTDMVFNASGSWS